MHSIPPDPFYLTGLQPFELSHSFPAWICFRLSSPQKGQKIQQLPVLLLSSPPVQP